MLTRIRIRKCRIVEALRLYTKFNDSVPIRIASYFHYSCSRAALSLRSYLNFYSHLRFSIFLFLSRLTHCLVNVQLLNNERAERITEMNARSVHRRVNDFCANWLGILSEYFERKVYKTRGDFNLKQRRARGEKLTRKQPKKW